MHAVNIILKDDKHVVCLETGNGFEECGDCMHICPYIFVCVFELDVRVNSFFFVLFNELIFHVGTMFIYQK